MKNDRKKIRVLTIFVGLIIFMYNVSFADVGSFETYDSGSSWSDSSWSSTDSYSDSGSWWDDDDYSNSREYNSTIEWESMDFFAFVITILLVIITFIIVFSILKAKNNGELKFKDNYNGYSNTNKKVNNAYYNRIQGEKQEFQKMFEGAEALENQVEMQIKQTDNAFNKDEFLSWARTVFVKLQEAWTDREWEKIRPLESNELFEQHKIQLQGYIENNTINVMDRICVKSVTLHEFRQDAGKDILTVKLNSRMNDYIIDATTKEVIKGNKYTEIESTYYLTFIRKTGEKTEIGNMEQIKTTNCPNCGAATQITSSGKCEYCGSIITTNDHNWVLSNLERA